jgi:hypothetical protein
MQDARIRCLAAAGVVVALATACGGSGGDSHATRVRADAEPASARRPATSSTTTATTSTTSASPVAAPVVSTTTTTGAPPPPAPAPTAPPVVTVSVAALHGGSITRSDGAACSNISSQTLALGRLELRRTGSTAAPLTVRYATSGAEGDFTSLPGAVTIPAGSSSATVDVTPTMTFGPAPQHVHRSSSVSFALVEDPAYAFAAPATAAVTLTFDVDVFGCDTPTS